MCQGLNDIIWYLTKKKEELRAIFFFEKELRAN